MCDRPVTVGKWYFHPMASIDTYGHAKPSSQLKRRRLTVSTVALKDVSKVWPDGTVAVDRVSLDVQDGEFMVLLGPSGCGKSTILRMIAGLEAPSAVAILLNGDPVMDLAPRDRQIAMVFQDFALYPT